MMYSRAYLVLAALADQPQHGHGVLADVHRLSGGRVRLHAGTLYAVLDRLRADGLVEVAREEVVESRPRRYYRLSGAGAERLAAETARQRRRTGPSWLRNERAALGGGVA